jgi:peptide/nickel transport system ATP-binding protein
MPPLLSVRNLTVAVHGDRGEVLVVRDVDLSIDSGEFVGLVGESGSGKTLTALAVLGLLPRQAVISSGRIELRGRDLSKCSPAALQSVRGNDVAMIFQEPSAALNPVLTVGYQICEPLKMQGLGKRQQREEAERLLEVVGMPAAASRLKDYPHQLSGGQRQRVMLAMALAGKPDLLIADEPTSALDVSVQAEVLELLEALRSRLGLAILLITHDLSVVAEACDRVMVMYSGQIVESGTVDSFFADPAHPYAQGLIAAMPRVGESDSSGRLPTLPGHVPDPADLPRGCAFHPRCSQVMATCRVSEPLLLSVRSRQEARCLLYESATGPGESG